jgi:hypothetical protein
MRYTKRRVVKRRVKTCSKRRHAKNCKCNRCYSRSKRANNTRRRAMKGG